MIARHAQQVEAEARLYGGHARGGKRYALVQAAIDHSAVPVEPRSVLCTSCGLTPTDCFCKGGPST